jgi:hypothetical protein
MKLATIVYTTQREGFDKKRFRYANPAFFNGSTRSDASAVVILGNWPNVRQAYEAAGIPVFDSIEAMDGAPAKKADAAPAPVDPFPPSSDPGPIGAALPERLPLNPPAQKRKPPEPKPAV